jgi:hypothetical protein
VLGILLATSLFIVEKPGGGGSAETEMCLATGKKVSDKGYPGGWGYPGPVLIGLSVIFGLIGNLIWLLSS